MKTQSTEAPCFAGCVFWVVAFAGPNLFSLSRLSWPFLGCCGSYLSGPVRPTPSMEGLTPSGKHVQQSAIFAMVCGMVESGGAVCKFGPWRSLSSSNKELPTSGALTGWRHTLRGAALLRETRALAGRALPSMNKPRNKGDQRGADMVRPYAQNQKGNPCRATALLTAFQFLGFDFKKKKKILP